MGPGLNRKLRIAMLRGERQGVGWGRWVCFCGGILRFPCSLYYVFTVRAGESERVMRGCAAVDALYGVGVGAG